MATKKKATRKPAKKKTTVKRKKKTAVKKKKRVSSPRVGTSQTARSMITKKAPSPRLKARRARNTEAGYYPNPKPKYIKGYVLGIRNKKTGETGYWTGTGWDTNMSAAVVYPNLDAAKGEIAHMPRKYLPGIGYERFAKDIKYIVGK